MEIRCKVLFFNDNLFCVMIYTSKNSRSKAMCLFIVCVCVINLAKKEGLVLHNFFNDYIVIHICIIVKYQYTLHCQHISPIYFTHPLEPSVLTQLLRSQKSTKKFWTENFSLKNICKKKQPNNYRINPSLKMLKNMYLTVVLNGVFY